MTNLFGQFRRRVLALVLIHRMLLGNICQQLIDGPPTVCGEILTRGIKEWKGR